MLTIFSQSNKIDVFISLINVYILGFVTIGSELTDWQYARRRVEQQTSKKASQDCLVSTTVKQS